MWFFDAFTLADEPGGAADHAAFRNVWHVEGEGRGTPVAAGDTVYFLSKHHQVIAVDRATGRTKWTRSTGEAGAETMGSSLVAAASCIIVGDYDVISFDEEGVVRWRFEPAEGYGPGLYLGGNTGAMVFAGSPSGRLYAIDARRGTERWSLSAGAATYTTIFAPIVEGDVVVAGFTTFSSPPAGGLLAAEAETGRVRWRVALPPAEVGASAGLTGGPLVAGTDVLITTDDGTIHVLDLENGVERRRLPPVGESGIADSGPVAHDFRALARTGRTLFAGSLTGTVVAYDIDTGAERWRRTPLDASVAFGIASDERAVYVPYLSGHLVVLDGETGLVRWRTGGAETGFSWMPRVDRDGFFAAASRAGFFAFLR